MRLKRLEIMFLVFVVMAFMAYFAFGAVNSITMNSPANNAWSTSANVTFSCTVVTNGSEGLGNISLRMSEPEGEALLVNSTNTTAALNDTANLISVVQMLEGNYTWSCWASNITGNISKTTNRTLHVDTTVPTPNLSSQAPADGNVSNASTMFFEWGVTDNMAVNISCNLSLNSAYNLTDGFGSARDAIASATVSGIEDGYYTWYVGCWDNATNTNTSVTKNFTIDTSYPLVDMTLTNGTWLNTGTVVLNATVTDDTHRQCDLHGNFNGTWQFNRTLNYTSGVVNSFTTVSNLPEGMHYWYINCNDSVNRINNSAVVNRSFYVDLTNPVPGISLSSASIATLGSLTITCSATDNMDGAPTKSLSSVQLPDSLESSDLDGTFTDTAATGTYTATCVANDASGNSASVSTTFEVSSTASSGSSSGSGSSAGSTVSKESHTITLPEGENKVITVSKPDNFGLRAVTIKASESLSNVKVTVEKLSSKPADLDEPAREAYSYVKVEAPLAEGKISSAKVEFEVTKAWMEEQGVTSGQIVMLRSVDDEWQELETKRTGTDSETEIFEATTTGFSVFVVTTKAVEEAEEEEETEEEPASTEEPIEEPESAEEPVEAASYTWLYVVLIIIVLAAIGAGVFFFLKKKKE